MKFLNSKAVAALSITLLLSTQAKGMGHDTELVLQTPMAQASVEVIKPSLTKQAVNVFSKAKDVTFENGKELAGKALNSASKYAGAAVEAGRSAVAYVAAHTPDIVKNIPSYVEGYEVPAVIGAGLVGYGVYKAYTPTKNAIKNAVSNPKVRAALALTPVVGVAGMVAYQNKEAISNMAKEVVNSISNGASAVKNADYAQYAQKAVTAVKPAGEFAGKQVAKLKINGARLVEAAKNVDYKGMASNAGQFIKDHKVAVGSVVAVPTVLGAGYVADKYVLPNLGSLAERKKAKEFAFKIANASDVVEVVNPEAVISVDDITKVVDHSPVTKAEVDSITSMLNPITPAQLSERAKAKPAPAQPRVAKAQNPAATILPGEAA